MLAFVLYYIIPYRKKIVRNNLIQSFPEKNIHEIKKIEKEFYRFLCRTIVETIKLISISKKELKKRCTYTPEFHQIFNHFYSEKKDVLVLMGHLGNWEWAGAAFNLYFSSPLYVLYHPLSIIPFNKLMITIRTRFGTRLIPMQIAYRYLLANTQKSAVFTFIADQCPSPQNAFWMNFLNQDTPVYYNPEVIARKLNLPVVFVWTNQLKKGYYRIDAKILASDIAGRNSENVPYPIMEAFMKQLENKIKQQPEIWLWSHKRWKHKRTI